MRTALCVLAAAALASWIGWRAGSARSASDGGLQPTVSHDPPAAFEAATRVDCAAEREALRSEVARLEARIAALQEEAFSRQEEWVGYTKMIRSIAPEDLLPELHAAAVAEELEATTEPEPPTPEEAARGERSEEIERSLRTLLVAEGIDAFDLLELGPLGDGWIGPVLLRSFDDRGRALGTLTAQRLRLEGSFAGRTLTIVLEDGYTRRSGERAAFPGAEEGAVSGGVRRLVLPSTDPGPWADALPELFQVDLAAEVLDDGRWSALVVRRELNLLLNAATTGLRYRIEDLAGVRRGVLRDVAIDELGEGDALRRRLFADRVTARVDERGVQLLLEGGVAVRGGSKVPFLDGRMRLFLPQADPEEWTDGRIPVVDAREPGGPAGAGSDAAAPR